MTSFLDMFTIRRNSKRERQLGSEQRQQVPRRKDRDRDRDKAGAGGELEPESEEEGGVPAQPVVNIPPRLVATHRRMSVKDEDKVAVRLLIFVEDADGQRSNIFDSAKYAGPGGAAVVNKRLSATAASATTSSSLTSSTLHSRPLDSGYSRSFTARTSGAGTKPPSNNFNKDVLSSKLNNEMIIRMVFGSFPMKVSNNTAIKVHSLKNSNRTMISNVFTYYYTRSDGSRAQPMCCCQAAASEKAAAPKSSDNDGGVESASTATSRPININPDERVINNHAIKTNEPLSSTCSSFNSPSIAINSLNESVKFGDAASVTCSSVPTHFGSYITIYKRLMRSVSNSLISSNTAIHTSNQDMSGSSLNNSFSFCQPPGNDRPAQDNWDRKPSTATVCEKCIEENCFPKYKIGVAVIYCLPRRKSSSTSSPPTRLPSSPTATTITSSCTITSASSHKLKPSPSTSKNTDKPHNKNYDMLVHFPSVASSPNSSSSTSSSSSSSGSSSSQSTPSPASPPGTDSSFLTSNLDDNTANNPNESFYEFFFSHLPLIEYQFKELREKISAHLYLCFMNNPKFNKHLHYRQSQHRFSISSQNSNTSSSNCPTVGNQVYLNQNVKSSSSLSSLGLNTNSQSTNNNMSFTRLILREFEIYDTKFNLLYSSPRLASPAWLTLMNSKKLQLLYSLGKDHSVPRTNHLANVSDALIKNFLNLKNLTHPSGSNEATVGHTNVQSPPAQQRSFDVKNLLENLKMFGASNGTTGATTVKENEADQDRRESEKRRRNEDTKQFLSTLLSTVLKHHLSWVYTVQPSNEPAGRSDDWTEDECVDEHKHRSKLKSRKDKKRISLRKQKAHWTRILEKVNPYNPLWAQLSDLHGAVNQPLKLVRTVVVGRDRALVEQVLFLLSYFIRCGNSSYYDIVQENFDFNRLNDIDENVNSLDTTTADKEVNIAELTFDPIVQFNNLLMMNSKAGATKKSSAGKSVKTFVKNTSLSSTSSLVVSPECSSSSSVSAASTGSSATSSSMFVSPFNTLSPPKSNDQLGKPAKLRRLSSNSNGQNCNAKELPLIGCHMKPNYLKSIRMQDNFGYSLLASYCDEFVFEFVLHGTSDRSFLADLRQRLIFSKNNSILDCPIDESMYIVIDVDSFEVKVFSSEQDEQTPSKQSPIGLVDSLVESVLDMIKLFQNSEFALIHLEDKLQELYAKSVTLNTLKSQSTCDIDDATLMKLIEINDSNDLQFLKQIVSALTIPTLF